VDSISESDAFQRSSLLESSVPKRVPKRIKDGNYGNTTFVYGTGARRIRERKFHSPTPVKRKEKGPYDAAGCRIMSLYLASNQTNAHGGKI